jgi:hypothetical protein
VNSGFIVTKLDAAKRQLEKAMQLYFANDDPVSIHTLTAAAYNILRDVSKQKGVEPMLIKGLLLDLVTPEHRGTFWDKVVEAENFFKHADRDAEASLEFNPDTTELMMFDAGIQYQKLAEELPPLFLVYRMWCAVKYPNIYILSPEYNNFIKENASSIVAMGREPFLANYLPMVANVAR